MNHVIDGEFQSDKYPWCKRGFVPLKITDPNARKVLRLYAQLRRSVDSDFSHDLLEAIRIEEERGPAHMRANDHGELPGEICCLRAASEFCHDHDPDPNKEE